MGKSKKKNAIKAAQGGQPKVSLEKQLAGKGVFRKNRKPKFRLRTEEEQGILDHKTSGKILAVARKQQIDEIVEKSISGSETSVKFKKPQLSGSSTTRQTKNESDDEENFGFEAEVEDNIVETDLLDELHINPEDQAAIDRFTQDTGKPTKKLCDIIMEKINEKQKDLSKKFSGDNESLIFEEINPKVREMYEGVRDVMKRYRSGKVPKAFKIIPKLRNWEQILFITEPHNWSAAAMYQGTRIFSSVLSPAMAQRFYYLVLLPRIRDDLSEFKRLNIHLYNAMKKALFKPAAFMKGVILPLLESGDCNLREAIIIGSIISRNTIPVLHSSACLLKICEMCYTGANSIFIRIFLDKRYALPYRVVDAAVFHFLRFSQDKRELPVLWHQSLLTFVQRYKNDISSEQKEALFELLRKKNHSKITPEIRRELQAGKCRDLEMMEADSDIVRSREVDDMEMDKTDF